MAEKKKNDEGKSVSEAVAEDVVAAEEVDQNEALLHQRHTGENVGYVDPLRDQEPDIAPERGVAPAVDLFNPAPPESVQESPAIGSEASDDPRAQSLEEKGEPDEDAPKAVGQELAEEAEDEEE